MASTDDARTLQPQMPVAVVGLACRLPRAPSPAAFWRLLCRGESAVTEMPAARRRADPASGACVARDTDRSRPTWFGGFLDWVDTFDAAFFGISPSEAVTMDPQQRLTLELSWEALEDAGIRPQTLSGSRTGVFMGAIWDEYAALLRSSGRYARTRHALTGSHRSIIANRVSYSYGLSGPSLTVDTAQSSGLVAVHLACESLRQAECTLALAGGVNLMLTEDGMEATAAQFGGLSPDGRCHTFDARANGFVRGEGGGMVVLKPLAAALADGDPVYCVIRGSAVNNDGATDGLAAPSPKAQQDVLRQAYELAGVAPADVQYVELHGTGTPVGDPVEAAALGAVLGAGRGAESPLLVGSAKTNVGHLEGAAGIVGLLKTALSIAHERIPASLNFRTPNPRIPLSELRLRVQDELTPWPRPDRPALAGVSSFGMGGTNCHVVLSGPPALAAAHTVPSRPAAAQAVAPALSWSVPWVLSAKSPAALRAQAARLRKHVAAHPGVAPADVGYALATTRTAFAHRAVVFGTNTGELLVRLEALEQGRDAARLTRGKVSDGRMAFLFSGQGSQRVGMGRELCGAFPVFAAALDDVCAYLDPYLDRPLHDVMLAAGGEPAESPLDQTSYTQPALFAIEVALYRLVESWGLKADYLMGHSVGELAAAHVAGVLSLPDACTLVAARGRLMQAVIANGGMAALQATEDEAAALLSGRDEQLSIAAINDPASVVVSGDLDAVRKAAAQWKARGRKATLLQVSHAFHSAHMDGVLDPLRSVAAGLSFAAPAVPIVSNVTGRVAAAELLTSPGYWAEHVRKPVRFMAGVRRLCEEGVTTFVELGPDGLLATMARACFPGPTGPDRPRPVAVATLRRGRPETMIFTSAMGEAYVRGAELNWDVVFGGRRQGRVSLPTYAFQRERYWPDTMPEPPAPPRTPKPAQAAAAAQTVTSVRQAALTDAEQSRELLKLVRATAAIVLGHDSPAAIDPGLTFKQLGFDSVAVTELSERLSVATGMSLPATLTFDYPTPAAVAGHLRARAAAPLAVATGSSTGTFCVQSDEPIAVVAMSCRYPGGADSPEQLWDLVAKGRDAVGEFPTERGWDLVGLFDPDPDRVGCSYAREGAFLYDADLFDAEFFGISPREAVAMDPQQRLLLEVSWEAFERAGIRAAALKGSPTGVFVGMTPQEYGPRLHEAPHGLDGYLLTAGTPSVASGRVAYTFGLGGPAVTVDTACSSSLVAVHLACQSLRLGECSLALAGGVTVMAAPGMFSEFSRQRGLARDGRCKPFAAAADGTGWGEGVGLVLLERLSEARRQGHRVWALVVGSAVNQDGASNGLTAPNGPAQQRVIRQALANAGLSAAQVDVVEAHGTGTRLGDPIEAQALLGTYGQARSAQRPLWLGSVKSNLGHTQAAAGIAGVIKMVMAIRHGLLPASLHIDAPSPQVDWDCGAVRLLTQPRSWPCDDHPRRAAVSSFGISGTNAHLIIEQPTTLEDPPPPSSTIADAEVLPWVISARTECGLRAQAQALATWLTDTQLPSLDVAWSLVTTRSVFEHRAVIIGHNQQTLLSGLRALAQGNHAHPVLLTGHASATATAQPVLVFPGQGTQWAGMGAELLDSCPAFAARIADCHTALAPHTDWSLTEVLHGSGPQLDRVDVIQPLLWAIMVSLAAVWAHHGVTPAAVVGHSQGELAAACIAGALSLPQAARIVALRSQALRTLTGTGMMASLDADREQAGALLADYGPDVVVAAINGPGSVVVSGPPEQVAAVVAACERTGTRARPIDVDYASHGPQVDAVREELTNALAGIQPKRAEVAFYSTVTGGRIDTTQLDTRYWVRNLREPVRFADAIDALLTDGHRAFIEVSPHPVLAMGMQDSFERAEVSAITVPTLRRDHGDRAQFLRAIGHAFTAGIDVDWIGCFPTDPAPQVVPLPTYAFQRQHYWWLPDRDRRGSDPSSLGLASAKHPLLGAAVELAGGDATLFTGRLSRYAQPWLTDHQIAGSIVLPGTVFAELALYAAVRTGCEQVAELTVHTPLVIPHDDAVNLQVTVAAPDETGQRSITIHSRPAASVSESAWTRHATGVLATAPLAVPIPADSAWPPPGATPIVLDDLYRDLDGRGYAYGPAFRGLRAAWRDGSDLIAEVVPPEAAAGDRGEFGIHPVLLDAALQPALLAGHPGDEHGSSDEHGSGDSRGPAEGRVWLPFIWSGVSLWASAATALRARLTFDQRAGCAERELRLLVTDAVGAPVLSADSVVLRRAAVGQLVAAGGRGTDGPRRSLPAPEAAPASRGRSAHWSARLATLRPTERHRTLLNLICGHAATVLGQPNPAAVHAHATFKDLGFESLTAVELRDRLAAATGLRLPTTLVFRQPTPTGLADYLLRLLAPEAADAEDTNTVDPVPQPRDDLSAAERLESASVDQVLDFIHNELGVS